MQRMIWIALVTAVLSLAAPLVTAAPAQADKYRIHSKHATEGACINQGNNLLDMASSGLSYFNCRKVRNAPKPWFLWVK